MQPDSSPPAPKLRPVIRHITAGALAVGAGLLAEVAFGNGFSWLPRSPIAWIVTLAVFGLGEGFLHWLLRQAKRVAQEDALFRGIGAHPPAGRDREIDRRAVAPSERLPRR
jgi:hypothetical protein